MVCVEVRMFFKKFFSKSTPSDPTADLLKLNTDGLRAFFEGDVEHFKKLDKSAYNLILKFRQDFVQPIAELTPEGYFKCFKPRVTEEQIVFVTRHANKVLTQILELKTINDQLINDFLKSNKRQQEHQILYAEIDKAFDDPNISNDISKHFQSALGKEFADEYAKKVNSKTFKRYLETGSKENFNAYVEENHSYLLEMHKKYDLGPVGYDIPEEE